MTITIFAKQKTSREGKAFYIFLSTLTNKQTGETMPVRVKFREAAGTPDPHMCPRVITFEKKNANMVREHYVNDDGEARQTATLWVSAWSDAGEYVDHSLDEFDD